MNGYLILYNKNDNYTNLEELKIKRILKEYSNINVNIQRHNINKKFTLYLFNNQNEEINNYYKEDNVLFYSGYLCENNKNIYDKIRKFGFNKAVTKLSGVFSIGVINDDECIMTSSLGSLETIYYQENDEFVAVSNRAILTNIIANKNEILEYELENFIGFFKRGYFVDMKMPYKNLEMLKPNQYIKLCKEKANIGVINEFNEGIYTLDLTDNYIDEVTEALLDSLQVLKKHESKISASLTGGLDSRTVIAAMKYLNLDFKTSTVGFDSNSDVIVAKKIAETLGIEHEAKTNSKQTQYMDINIEKRVRQSILSSEGLISAYENIPYGKGFNPKNIVIGGQEGEVLRGGYAHKAKGPVESRDEYIKLLIYSFNTACMFFNKDVNDKYFYDIVNYYEESYPNLTYSDILHKTFLEVSFSMWSAIGRKAANIYKYIYSPFYDNAFLMKAQLLKTDQSLDGRVQYEMLKRLSPELLEVPLAGKRWKFEEDRPEIIDDNNINKWLKTIPVFPTEALGSYNWRKTINQNFKKEFKEYLLDNNQSDVYTLIKRNVVEKVFNEEKVGYDAFLWNVYTAISLMSNDWVKEKEYDFKRIEIKKDKGKMSIYLRENTPIVYEDIYSMNSNIKLEKKSQYSTEVLWNNENNKANLYIQVFDNKFTTPPSEKFEYKSNISKLESIEGKIDLEKETSYPFEIEMYMMQYDENGRISNQMQRFLIDKQLNNISMKTKVVQGAKWMKIAIRIKDDNLEGKFLIKFFRINKFS